MKTTVLRSTLVIISFLIFSPFFKACNKDNDTEKPVIGLLSPAHGARFHPGDIIHLDAEVSDNVGLEQMKIDIHREGGHTHKSYLLGRIEWHWDSIIDISGRNRHIHLDIPIPANANHGGYHFIIYALDKAGNEAFNSVDIHIDELLP